VFGTADFYHAAMRSDYLREALKKVDDPNILINVVSRRVKQLRRGNRALVESLEKLSAEDIALREVIEGKISYDLADAEVPVVTRGLSRP
jgi:DNA-directed RNA polymerase subunit omega